MRIAHCRFFKKEPIFKKEDGDNSKNCFDRVVTIAWKLDKTTGILEYGLTVFRKKGISDHWNKRSHRNTAVDRFQNNPVRIHIRKLFPTEIDHIAMNWYIAEYLLYKYGSRNISDIATEGDTRIHEVKIYPDFNQTYSKKVLKNIQTSSEYRSHGDYNTQRQPPHDSVYPILYVGSGIILYGVIHLLYFLIILS